LVNVNAYKLLSVLTVFTISVLFFSTSENYSKVDEQDLKESMKRGKHVYMSMCVSCHLPNGKGMGKIYPPLANADYLLEKREESIRAVKYGLKGKIVVNGVTYNNMMSPLGLDDKEVADVMNYILNSWGNKSDKIVTVKEVKTISKN